MPSPNDQWLAGRHFGIVIDAGSSGSRLQIYSWANAISALRDGADPRSLPKVEKGTKDKDDWVKKTTPGISTFADNPHGIAGYLKPLLQHAIDHIPPTLHSKTPLFLLATAGMRLLPPKEQASVLTEACHFLSRHSNFRIESASAAGPCGSSIRIITGEEEGLFGWIAVNYLMDGFVGKTDAATTYGFLDMGGASTQIAFEPSAEAQKDTESTLIDVRLRRLNGREIHHKVFTTTWLGYGTNQARERYVGAAIDELEKTRHHHADGHEDADVVLDPCLPKDLEMDGRPVHLGPGTSAHANKVHHIRGTGSFEQCLEKTAALLNKNAPCPDSPCLMNGIHVPHIDFSVSHFIGVSEYWYSSEHIFGLGGVYDFVQYERAASNFCSLPWKDLDGAHKEAVRQQHLGGDGEVFDPKTGNVVKVGEWNGKDELKRLQLQCFKAAWIVNVLHEGLGMPRIVDAGGNSTTEGDHVKKQAESKGLGRPVFQSMDTVDDIAISWTLGKMVLEASKEVQPASKKDKPLMDPLEDLGEHASDPNFPIKPIRPVIADSLEDELDEHIQTRSSTGLSPFALFIWVVVLVVLFVQRKRARSIVVALARRISKPRDGDLFSLEEGSNYSGPRSALPRRTINPLLDPIKRALSGGPQSKPRLPPNVPNGSYHNQPSGQNGQYGGYGPNASTRPYPFPTNQSIATSVSASSISRSSSPAPDERPRSRTASYAGLPAPRPATRASMYDPDA